MQVHRSTSATQRPSLDLDKSKPSVHARRSGVGLDEMRPALQAPHGLGLDASSPDAHGRRGLGVRGVKPALQALSGLGGSQPAVHGRPGLGLYQIKPAFQARLAGLADFLTALGVHPDVLTFAGVGCGLAGGAALVEGVVLNQPVLLVAVALFAFTRLAFNALDGMVAVRAGIARPWGKVLNELCDRLADLAFLAPLLLVPGISTTLVSAALCTSLLVSYLGVLAEAAGAPRQYGGVLGKADRMLWLGLATLATAATGSLLPLQLLPYVLLIGGTLTLLERGKRTHAAL